MTCIIIDDETTARAVVRHLCSQVQELKVIEEFDNAVDAIKFLNQQTIDVIFLDIHMPGFTGMDFVQTLKNPPHIVLTTSDTDYAIEAYQYASIVDYLVKPINFQRFEIAIQKIKNIKQNDVQKQSLASSSNSLNQELYINIDRRLIKLRYDEILLVMAQGDYIEITSDNKKYRVHTTLKKIKEKLPETIFLQIHRSYIINFTKIIDIEDNSVLIDKNVIPISRSSRPELMRRLNLV